MPLETPTQICNGKDVHNFDFVCLYQVLTLKWLIFHITENVFCFVTQLGCDTCKATWTAGQDNLIKDEYWPAALHFATIYSKDIFY